MGFSKGETVHWEELTICDGTKTTKVRYKRIAEAKKVSPLFPKSKELVDDKRNRTRLCPPAAAPGRRPVIPSAA